MKAIILDKELFDFIQESCDKFKERTHDFYDVTVEDVLYSYFNPGMILNDWGEGEGNDPFWDKESNTHSAILFINSLANELKSIH